MLLIAHSRLFLDKKGQLLNAHSVTDTDVRVLIINRNPN